MEAQNNVEISQQDGGAPVGSPVLPGVRVSKVQKIRISSAILESIMTTGAMIPQRLVAAGLPEGSLFAGAECRSMDELILYFALPDGCEPSSDEHIVLQQPKQEKVYKIQRRADGKFSLGGSYADTLAWKWSTPGKIWSALKNLRAHLAQFRFVPGDWDVVEYSLVESDRRPASSYVPPVH